MMMSSATHLCLSDWQYFYAIVGSAAGALTGLQFIVITLIAQTRTPGSSREISAFGTPTVGHFCMALLVSAVMVMPWQEPAGLGICLGVSGAAGVGYSIRVVWHAGKANYTPDAADWLWYTALPIVAHLTLVVGAGLLWHSLTWSLFTIGGNVLFFLFLGIHNSWDTVTYIAIKAGEKSRSADGKNMEVETREEDTK